MCVVRDAGGEVGRGVQRGANAWGAGNQRDRREATGATPHGPWPTTRGIPVGLSEYAHDEDCRRMLAASAGDRRVRQHHFDPADLLATADPRARSASDTSASGDADPPGAAYAAALTRWRQDILAAAEPNAAAMDTGLILFSMRAGTYLANTRTAAYLWVTAYPAEAQRLLTDEGYCADYLAPLVPEEVSTAAVLTAELIGQVVAAQNSVASSQVLLTVPAVDGCASPAATVANRLATELAVLLPEDDDSPRSGAEAR